MVGQGAHGVGHVYGSSQDPDRDGSALVWLPISGSASR